MGFDISCKLSPLKFQKRGKRKVHGVPQSQTAALPRHQEEAETDKSNKHKSNKRTKSTKVSSLFPKRDNLNAKRTEKHKNKIAQGKTKNKNLFFFFFFFFFFSFLFFFLELPNDRQMMLERLGPEIIKLFMRMKFPLAINMKMLTTARKNAFASNLRFNSRKIFMLSRVENEKKFYNLGARVLITKTCLCNLDPLKLVFYIVKLGLTGVYIIFLISAQNIDYGYSLEPP